MKLFLKNKQNIFVYACVPLFSIVAILFYLNYNYQRLPVGIESIKIIFDNQDLSTPVVYITDSLDVETNFRKESFKEKTNDSTFTVFFGRKIKLRQFRTYFSSTDIITLKRVVLQYDDHEIEIDLSRFIGSNLKIIDQNETRISFTVLQGDGYSYFESPNFYYPTDYPPLLASVIAVIFLALLVFFLISQLTISLSSITLHELSVMVFITSIFLPQRIFNIALAVSFLVVIRNFKLRHFSYNKANFLFVGIYFMILLNAFIIFPEGDFKSIEKYALFLALPFYASSIRSGRTLIFFFFASILIGLVLLSGALTDIAIFKNLKIISFSHFTRTIHPVYYSYLLAFSILYIEYQVFVKYKYLIQLILLLLLILSGSKLIIFSMVIWLVFFLRKQISIAVAAVVILVSLLFGPANERFGSIASISDLSVVTEKHINNPDDPRLNGLTLRVILWQESLRLNNVKELFFGKGVSPSGSKVLESNLQQRGLIKHLEFNSHNQYVTMMFKTGIVGLILLITLIFYCIRWGIKTNDKVLIYFTLLMSFAMLSESIFERASGIAFFGVAILLLINSNLLSRERHNL